MIKTLPIKYPDIRAYPHHAIPWAILLENRKNELWFYNNCFQLVLRKSTLRLDFNKWFKILMYFKKCPMLISKSVCRKKINKNYSNISEFIINMIDLEFYIYLVVDRYYISSYQDYYNTHKSEHTVLIYGYNKKDKYFNIADFFKNGVYSYSTTSFSSIDTSYKKSYHLDWVDGAILLKRKKPKSYHFNHKKFKKLIKDYLKSRNSMRFRIKHNCELKNKDLVYGLAIYKYLREYLVNITNNNDVNNQVFHVLYEHKILINRAIRYLIENGDLKQSDYILDSYSQILDKSLILRNEILKYFISQKKHVVAQALNNLNWIEKKERDIIPILLKSINHKSNISRTN